MIVLRVLAKSETNIETTEIQEILSYMTEQILNQGLRMNGNERKNIYCPQMIIIAMSIWSRSK